MKITGPHRADISIEVALQECEQIENQIEAIEHDEQRIKNAFRVFNLDMSISKDLPPIKKVSRLVRWTVQERDASIVVPGYRCSQIHLVTGERIRRYADTMEDHRIPSGEDRWIERIRSDSIEESVEILQRLQSNAIILLGRKLTVSLGQRLEHPSSTSWSSRNFPAYYSIDRVVTQSASPISPLGADQAGHRQALRPWLDVVHSGTNSRFPLVSVDSIESKDSTSLHFSMLVAKKTFKSSRIFLRMPRKNMLSNVSWRRSFRHGMNWNSKQQFTRTKPIKWSELSYRHRRDWLTLSDVLQSSRWDHSLRGRAHRSALNHERNASCQTISSGSGLLGESHRTDLGDMRRSLQRSTAMVIHGRDIHFGWCSTTIGSRISGIQVDQCHLARGHSREDPTGTECIARGNTTEWEEKTASTLLDYFNGLLLHCRSPR